MQLLLLSSIITLVLAMLIQPVIAKPVMTIHYHNVETVQAALAEQRQQRSTLIANLPSNPVNRLLNQYVNNIDTNLSNRLVLSSVRKVAENGPKKHLNNLNNHNGFFETAMIFNDKMQQLISYFKSPSKNNSIEVKSQQKECNA